MNRTVVIVLTAFVLFSGATATAAAFTDGDEVAPDSEVYLDAADSDNGEQYVQIDDTDRVRLQFNTLPPGSQTRVNDLFVIGFAGYEDSDNATEVRVESTDDRVTLERMDTGETFGNGTVELQPGESVLFGAVISTSAQGFSSTIELTVDVPDDDADNNGGNVGGGGSGGGGGSSASEGSGAAVDDDTDADDDADEEEFDEEDGDTPGGESGNGEDGEDGTRDDDGAVAGDDGDLGAGADPGDLIELAGFGTPISLGAVGGIATILTFSYVYRIRVAAGGVASNMGGSE
ncbi:hypothetical protein [Halorubrum sp. PV6]|uniref:hypothetical protein n=1 Tax=Halorubrum sp. PV6 TaxID=634157 RepID=UPI001198CA43|nr:hypothetical protein [Halorubrum sp. PV6]AZQ16084.1 hypothetical protein DOS48_14565 [Halorubrum sp. PV6]